MSLRVRSPLYSVFTLVVLLLVLPVNPAGTEGILSSESSYLNGLSAPARIVRDSENQPHVFARTERDAVYLLGYLHARDRLFQMDYARHLFSGTLAELVGPSALSSDIEFRIIGARRAAEKSLPAYSPETLGLLERYAEGVNACLADLTGDLPPEYARLEISEISPWTVTDTLTVAKGIALGLSADIGDIGLTETLEAYQRQGALHSFDGTALFFQDLFRVAPFDRTVTIPVEDALKGPASRALSPPWTVPGRVRPETARLARRYLERVRSVPGLEEFLTASQRQSGSNLWIVSGENSETGYPLLANDPHLSFGMPATFYEVHIVVEDDPVSGKLNVNGVTFAGTPGVAQGCNTRICWGSTVNPMDVTDVYQEELKVSLLTQRITHTVFEGQSEPVVVLPQAYFVNQRDNGVLDDLRQEVVGGTEGGIVYLVPRRNFGPILDVDLSQFPKIYGLSVQFSGLGATRELETFFRFARATNIEEFKEALQFFDFGSQNWAYADVEGNIGYFTSGELPLREDLEAGAVDGQPPFLIRDGTHQFKNEWLPEVPASPGQALEFKILPFEEMPQVVNPSAGYIVNGNNDPIGVTLDNDPLDTYRASTGGILYLSPGFTSLRAGQIARLIREVLEAEGRLSLEDMKRIQASQQLLDAEVFRPFISRAFENSRMASASSRLKELGADPAVTEAVGRLEDWDYSTPTGLKEGYDPGDDPHNLPDPTDREVRNSIAATIYAVWRGRFIRNIIDATLARYDLQASTPDSERSLAALRHMLEEFDGQRGVGASGVNFFDVEGAANPDDARDIVLLESLKEALDHLAGPEFDPAFEGSTSQADYRWGRLHRIVFDHPAFSDFSVPEAGGFASLNPTLRGLARSGGWEVIDASSHSAKAGRWDEFTFGSGPARRFVAELSAEGIRAHQIIPGGPSGDPESPWYASQLGRWLTNQYRQLRFSAEDVAEDTVSELQLLPEAVRLIFPYYHGDSHTFTAFAAANVADSDLELEFDAWTPEGNRAPFPANPSHQDLPPGRQLARLASELFGVPASTSQAGWVEVFVTGQKSMPPAAASFMQFGGFDLGHLDGAVAIHSPANRLIFSRAYQGSESFQGRNARTWLSIANPGPAEARVELRLFRAAAPGEDGEVGASPEASVVRDIPAHGVLFGEIGGQGGIFPVGSIDGGYVEALVRTGEGIAGFEVVELPEAGTVIGLNASAGNSRQTSFSAQLAELTSIFTSISLINTDEFPRRVILEAVPEGGGSPILSPELLLEPGGAMQADASEFFDQLPANGIVGSLVVHADGPGMVGDVVFGDPAKGAFAAALPLQTRPFTRAVFGHVANLGDFFTGLAFFNPNASQCRVSLEVFSLDGQLTGTSEISLEGGGRVSKTLRELVAGAADQVGGFIVVESDLPLVGQELFGTFGLTLQSAVPPTVLE